MKRKSFSTLIAVSLLSIIMAGFLLPFDKALGATYEWKFGADGYHDQLVGVFCRKFADSLAKHSNGDINLRIYYYGELGTMTEVNEVLQSGGIEFGSASPGIIAIYVPALEVFSVPYIFPPDLEIYRKVVNKQGTIYTKIFNEEYAKKNMKLIGYWTEGFKAWSSNKPLTTVADFKNFKMRVTSAKLLVESYRALGANTTVIPYGELYTALQLGMVEGQENPLSALWDMKFYEVQKYATKCFLFPIVGATAAYLPVWEKLPDNIKEIVYKAHDEAIADIYPQMYAREEDYVKKVLEKKPSFQVNTLTPQQIYSFKKTLLPIRDIYIQMAGERGKQVLDSLVKEVEKEVVK